MLMEISKLGLAQTKGGGVPLLAPGASMLFIGDSIIAANNTVADTAGVFNYLYDTANGEITTASVIDRRFRQKTFYKAAGNPNSAYKFDGSNQGNVGTISNRLVSPAERSHIATLPRDIVVIAFGANDWPLGVTVEQAIANHVSFFDWAFANGVQKVIVATTRPHVKAGGPSSIYNYPDGDAKWQAHKQFNEWVRSLDSLYPGRVFGWETGKYTGDLHVDPTFGEIPYGIAKTKMLRDGLHLTDRGAYFGARSFLEVLERVVSPGTWFNPADYVNLLPNGALAGSGGTGGAGVSGIIPASCSLVRSSGSLAEAVGSRDANGNYVITINPNGATVAETFRLRFHPSSTLSTPALAGGFGSLFLPFQISASMDFAAFGCTLADNTGGNIGASNRYYTNTVADAAFSWHGEAVSGLLATPAVPFAPSSTGLRADLNVSVFGNGGAPIVVTLPPNVIAASVPSPAS